jgi:hypothetical protein
MSGSHAKNIISASIRNPKFLPVMNGKNSELGTRNAKNGTIKILTRIILRKIASMFDVFITINYITKKKAQATYLRPPIIDKIQYQKALCPLKLIK